MAKGCSGSLLCLVVSSGGFIAVKMKTVEFPRLKCFALEGESGLMQCFEKAPRVARIPLPQSRSTAELCTLVCERRRGERR